MLDEIVETRIRSKERFGGVPSTQSWENLQKRVVEADIEENARPRSYPERLVRYDQKTRVQFKEMKLCEGDFCLFNLFICLILST